MGSHSYLQNLCSGSACNQMQTGQNPRYLQNLNFEFTPTMGGDSKLTSGEIIAGSAGEVNIKGDNNKFVQGSSTSSADSSAGGAATGSATSGGTSSSAASGDAAAAAALKKSMGLTQLFLVRL